MIPQAAGENTQRSGCGASNFSAVYFLSALCAQPRHIMGECTDMLQMQFPTGCIRPQRTGKSHSKILRLPQDLLCNFHFLRREGVKGVDIHIASGKVIVILQGLHQRIRNFLGIVIYCMKQRVIGCKNGRKILQFIPQRAALPVFLQLLCRALQHSGRYRIRLQFIYRTQQQWDIPILPFLPFVNTEAIPKG